MGQSPMSHVNQHYVPEFLLREWAAQDKKLTHFSRRFDGAMIEGRCGPKGAGYKEHLYSLHVPNAKKDTQLERNFFGPLVDDPAAPVHKRLLAGDVESLTDQEVSAWSRFLVAQIVRVPSMVSYFLEAGRAMMLSDVDDALTPAEIAAELNGRSLREYLETDGAWRLDNASTRALQVIIETPQLNEVFHHAIWATIEFAGAKSTLLIGDRPLIYEGQMADDFLFLLPISPATIFVAARSRETIENLSSADEGEVLLSLNKATVSLADQYVYSVDGAQRELIDAHLRKSDDPDVRHVVASLRARLKQRATDGDQ